MILLDLALLILPESIPVLVLGAIGSMLVLFGYPFWVVFHSGLPTNPKSKWVVGFSLAWLGSLVALLIALPELSQPTEPDVSSPALWKFPFGLVCAFAGFAPLVVAARILRTAELARGITITAGGVSAFLWFLYFPLGWGPLHRRVRAAAGVT